MEDRGMIACIQGGQKEYLNSIAEKYYDDIYYFCCYQSGSKEDAYDLAQETFLRFIRYAGRYREKNLKGYLLTIAMNLCRDYFASVRGKHMEEWREEHAEAKSSDLGNAEASVLLKEALAALPQAQREAVLLHHFYGYKNREIARMTGASYAAVKSRVRQGMEKLQFLLNQEDFYG